VLFLGTGTSHGVPAIGCDCDVCHSTDPRDNRTRSSIYVLTDDGLGILVDTSPDLRTQALRENIRRVDSVLLTHTHADHLMGLDETRRFNMLSGLPIPVYGEAPALEEVRRTFSYAFAPGAPRGGGVPDLRLFPIGGPFCLGRLEVVPLPLRHGPWDILGFRLGGLAYLTDCNAIPAESWARLQGVEVLVLDALRHTPHPTHFTLEEAMAVAHRLGAGRTFFTHIAHDLAHAETCARLPATMALAYDGLQVEC
jgi:phosphoribosyl 1,2-cyclic phosphate phosphodiesterase